MASASRPLTRLEQEILRRIIMLGEAQDRQLAEQIEDLVVAEEIEGEFIFVSSPDAQGSLSRRAMVRDLSALEFLNYDGITLDETTVDPAQITVSTEAQ